SSLGRDDLSAFQDEKHRHSLNAAVVATAREHGFVLHAVFAARLQQVEDEALGFITLKIERGRSAPMVVIDFEHVVPIWHHGFPKSQGQLLAELTADALSSERANISPVAGRQQRGIDGEAKGPDKARAKAPEHAAGAAPVVATIKGADVRRR